MSERASALWLAWALGCACSAARGPLAQSDAVPDGEALSPGEMRRILQHSPLPPPPADPTNRFADDPRAARLGQFLFFDTELSRGGQISCATCHDPGRGFADGRPLGRGLGDLERHVPALWNAAYQRWYFWDGRSDSLWAQAVQPIEHPDEMGGSRCAVAHRIYRDPPLRGFYEALFGPLPDLGDAARFPADASPGDDSARRSSPKRIPSPAWDAMTRDDQDAVNRVIANVGKALAAYERKLVSRRSAFDVFVEGIRERDASKRDALTPAAQRGLRLFVGRGGCRVCHSGPNFTDGEFHAIGVPASQPAIAMREGSTPEADAGRYEGARRLLADPFNAVGAFSDDRGGDAAERIRGLVNRSDTWGQFKTPSLRNVAATAPYMRRGQLATLDDVLRFYSTLEGQVLPPGHHAHETLLRPLSLTDDERRDLVAFLESLTDERIDSSLTRPLNVTELPTPLEPQRP